MKHVIYPNNPIEIQVGEDGPTAMVSYIPGTGFLVYQVEASSTVTLGAGDA